MKVVRKGFWRRWYWSRALQGGKKNILRLLREEQPGQRGVGEQNLSPGRGAEEWTGRDRGQRHSEEVADVGPCSGLAGAGPWWLR